jgi:hypothetical protein
MGSFREYRLEQLDPVLRDEAGEAWSEGLGDREDVELELMKSAAQARLPGRCPDDALGPVGEAYALDRYPAHTDATYRAALKIAFPTHRKKGAAEAIEDQIRAFGIPDVRVYAAYEGEFGPDPRADYAEFWVFLGPDFGSTGIGLLILGDWILGSGATLGTTATRAQIVSLKRIILRWKALHGYPVKIILLFGSGPILGVGIAGGARPLTLGSFTLGGATTIAWPIGRTMNDTLPTLGSDGFILGGYVI